MYRKIKNSNELSSKLDDTLQRLDMLRHDLDDIPFPITSEEMSDYVSNVVNYSSILQLAYQAISRDEYGEDISAHIRQINKEIDSLSSRI